MIELAQHIEVLLLENDCVIVPGLGGFVAHYTSAMRMTEENIFLPPTRHIGFNPQLKMNDGLLVQSYMTVYDTNFSDATHIVEKKVEEVFATLHEEGKVDLPNIGELRCSIHGTYEFTPYDNKITTPYLYGLDSFEMQELADMRKPCIEEIIPAAIPTASESKKQKFEIKFKRSYLSNAVAMIAVIVLFFFLSTPIKNTEVVEGNYAQMLPGELFGKIEKQSLAIHPIVIKQPEVPQTATQKKTTKGKSKKTVVPVSVKEVKISRPADQTSSEASIPAPSSSPVPTAAPAVPAKPVTIQQPKPAAMYHIIVASVGTEKDADVMAKQLVEKGFPHAKAIIGDSKMRVSIESFATETEAYQTLNKIRQNGIYKDAWVLKK